jgi:hypothetical protein
VGCSGTGSPAVEMLARAQIGEFVLVDAKRGVLSNLERMHGSRFADLSNSSPYKVALTARLIREVNPSAKVTMLVGNALDDRVIDELLRCDIVLGCTDTLHGRAALGDLAALHLIPAIDVGVRPHGNTGKVTAQMIDMTRLGPGDPCPFCLGRIDAHALSAELMPESERQERREAAAAAIRRGEDGTAYWGGDIPLLPAVGYLTTVAGSLAAGYALNWLLGTAQMPHSHFQFDVGASEFAFAADTTQRRPSCSCSRQLGFGDCGDRSVTMPKHFARAIELGDAERDILNGASHQHVRSDRRWFARLLDRWRN